MANQSPDSLKELMQKIHQFILHQVEHNSSLDEAAKEGLTVATECIEQAYNIQRQPASAELLDIYSSHKRQGTSSTATGAQQQPDPAQLLTNLASSIFSQVGGGLLGQAGAQQPPSANQPQSATQATADTQADNRGPERPAAPRRERKKVTEAERLAAESFKNQGNDLMKQEKHKEAYDSYSQAIEIDNNNAIYYSNRAAASAKIGDHQAALRDCQEAIEIDPRYSKAWGRLGLAYASLNNHKEAKKAYVKAVELDPSNDSYKSNLAAAEIAERQSRGLDGAPAAASAGSGGLGGSNMMQMLGSMMSNPQVVSMAMQSLQDPRIQGMFGMGGGGSTNSNTDTQSAATGTTEQQQQQQPQPSAPEAPQQSQQSQRQQSTPSAGSQPNSEENQQQQRQPSVNPAHLLGQAFGGARNINDLVGAVPQMMSSIQENNPQLMDNMRRLMSQALNPNGGAGGGANRNDNNPPPGYS